MEVGRGGSQDEADLFCNIPEWTASLVPWLQTSSSGASVCCADGTSQTPALRNTHPGPWPGDRGGCSLRVDWRGLQGEEPKEGSGPPGSRWLALVPSRRPAGPHAAAGEAWKLPSLRRRPCRPVLNSSFGNTTDRALMHCKEPKGGGILNHPTGFLFLLFLTVDFSSVSPRPSWAVKARVPLRTPLPRPVMRSRFGTRGGFLGSRSPDGQSCRPLSKAGSDPLRALPW